MTFNYETLGNSSYLVIDFNSDENIINYQMQMLVNNDIKNIVKANKQQKNNNIQIYYNITSRISLEQALQHGKISKAGLINIIEGALDALAEIEEYQLASSGILFDEKYVFVKPGSFEPSFIYVPTSNENVGAEPLKKLILDLVVSSKVEVTNDNFIQVLLETLNSNSVGTEQLRQLCAQQKKVRTPQPEKKVNAAPMPVKNIPPVQQEQPAAGNVRQVQTPPSVQKPPAVRQPAVPQPPQKVDAAEKKKEKPEKPNKNKFLLLQAAFVAVLLGIVFSGVLNDASGNINYSYLGGIVMALAGIDFIIYREMFVNNKDTKDKKEKQPIAKKEVPANKNVSVPASVSASQPSYNPPEIMRKVPEQPVSVESRPAPNRYQAPDFESDDTDVLVADDGAYLEYFENGLATKIHLDKESTIVGKLSSQCDFAIRNNKVSKMHAEFISRNGKYFVKDYNSTNGTYINGNSQRIQSNAEYPINNGDRITLANVDLTFRC